MSDLPTPITRKEQFLNSIARGNTSDLPTPITREEEYLDAIAKSGGGSGDGDMKKSVYDSDLAVANAGGISAFVSDAISGKVDKVEGKGLSTNDYDNTEKGKVADNTSAIEAIENVTGAKNLAPNNAVSQTINGITLTVNSDKSITASAGTATDDIVLTLCSSDAFGKYPAGSYELTGCPLGGSLSTYYIVADLQDTIVNSLIDTGSGDEKTYTSDVTLAHDGSYSLKIKSGTVISEPITFKPMIRPAGTDPTYVPYAMTNRELTERAIDAEKPQTGQIILGCVMSTKSVYGSYVGVIPFPNADKISSISVVDAHTYDGNTATFVTLSVSYVAGRNNNSLEVSGTDTALSGSYVLVTVNIS